MVDRVTNTALIVVLGSHVGDRRLATQSGVTPLVVVVLEPRCKGFGALGVGADWSAVGPLTLQRAVEAFDLAAATGSADG